MTKRTRARRRVIVSLMALGIVLAVSVPAQAGSGCLYNGVCYIVSAGGPQGTVVTLNGQPRVGNYVTLHYNVTVNGGRQFEVPVSRSFRAFSVNWGGNVSVQACRRLFFGSRCTSWDTFQAW